MAHNNANTDANSVAQSADNGAINTNTAEANALTAPTLTLFKDAEALQADANADAEARNSANEPCYWYVARSQTLTLFWNREAWRVLKANGITLTHKDKNGTTVKTLYANQVASANDYNNLSRIFKDNAKVFKNITEAKERQRQAQAEAL